MAFEGYIQIQAPIMPTNDNPRGYVSDNKYIKGSPQVFAEIAELVAIHPNRLKPGNSATILNYPQVGVITDFRLVVDPSTMLDSSNNTIVTEDNFSQFWQVQSTIETSRTRVYQYSADGPGGGAPVFPYTEDEEDNWVNTFDNSKGHRWLRFRDDDVDANEDGIYDNWTAPISVNNTYASGDYLENRFKRQAISSTTHTGIGTMTADKYYIVETGQIQITGDLSLNEIGAYGSTTTVILGTGRRFKYAAANSYSFLSATAVETIPAPPRTINGLPNNEPTGWDDTIPGGSAQLWQITAQKSVYGQLKSEWIVQKVIENPSFIRYNNVPTPHPDTLAGTTDAATTGSAEDLALIAAGWDSTYDNHTFIAKRQADGGDYTPWVVEKINEESGEYTDRVFKLFELNLDLDSPVLAPPTLRDPTSEGFSDTPLVETDVLINYVSEARKFFNGELKTSWSPLIPYTGKDIFSDIIESNFGDNFKYDINDAVTPALITLRGLLYKGTSELWQNPDLTITYAWKKVYDNGAVVDVTPTESTSDDFYLLGSNGSPGDADYARNHQRLAIKPAAVDGHAIFRLVQTLSMADADDLVFEEEFSILDVTDGKDAKSLAVTADADKIIYDTVGTAFLPTTIVLRVYSSNIPSVVYKWYKWNGASWAALTNGVGGYTITGNTCSIDSDDLFVADDSGQQAQFAASNHASNPLSADYVTTFSDYITIVKLSSAGVGSDGADSLSAILSNESHTIVIDSSTGSPYAGEITSTGKAKTTLQLYEGLTKLDYPDDYTIAVASDNGDVDFDYVVNTNGIDVDVFVDTWTAGEISAVCTITITYGSNVLSRKFSISSTQDAPGAILLDIDSDKGFIFTPTDKTDKVLTAKLYDTALSGDQAISLPDAAYTFRFNVAGTWGSTSTANTKTITRSNILVSGQVIVECYLDAVLFRSRTITIADVNDGKSYRAWTSNATKPSTSQDLGSQDPTGGGWPYTVSGVVWRLATDSHWNTNTPTYAQDATEAAGVYTWGPVYQLKGEKGDQGTSGNFFFSMYKVEDPGPPAFGAGGASSTLAQMLSASWLSKPPSTGIIWKTDRPWVGDGVSFNGSGDPSTAPVSGTTWSNPIRLSAKDGTNGVGVDGINGWSPVWSIVSGAVAGTKVVLITDWTGGTGTKPGTGVYITASGFSANINLAQTVTGEPVEMRFSGGVVQWKYTNESAGSWRTLYTPALYPTGNVYRQANFSNNNSYVNDTGRTYSSFSFITSEDARHKPLINFFAQVTGDGGGIDSFFAVIERSLDNDSFDPIRSDIFTTDSGSHAQINVYHLDVDAAVSTTYFYRLRFQSISGTRANYSFDWGGTITTSFRN